MLETRRAVLAKRYDVIAIDSLEGIAQVSPMTEIDLVLLCHTLSPDECHAAADIARHRWPGTKLMALSSGEPSCAHTDADRDFCCLDGPTALLQAVQELTKGRPANAFPASI